MFVTRKADYAIRCVLHLSRFPERLMSVDEISKAVHIPKTFLAKILQLLLKAGIVNSARGAKGGFQLARDPREINLLEVIETVQGKSAASMCAIDDKACKLSNRCSVHPVWIKIRAMIEEELKNQNLEVLAKNENIKQGGKLPEV